MQVDNSKNFGVENIFLNSENSWSKFEYQTDMVLTQMCLFRLEMWRNHSRLCLSDTRFVQARVYVFAGIQPMALNSSHGHGAMKYADQAGQPHNSDTFQDFVSLVCQEANNPQQPGQVTVTCSKG